MISRFRHKTLVIATINVVYENRIFANSAISHILTNSATQENSAVGVKKGKNETSCVPPCRFFQPRSPEVHFYKYLRYLLSFSS